MPAPRPTPNPNAGRGLERAIAVGMDLVKQAREVAKANSAPATRERQMAAEHRAALVRHEAELRKHQGRIAGARAGMVAGGAGTAALSLAAIGSTSGGVLDTVLLGGLAVGSAALGWRAQRRAFL